MSLAGQMTWSEGIQTLSLWCETMGMDMASIPLPRPPCSATSAYIGATGELSRLNHGVRGRITIVDDCSFVIDGFSYDGAAPQTQILVAASGAPSDIASGVHASGPIGSALAGANSLFFRLPGSATFCDDMTFISVWCVAVGVDFGSVSLAEFELPDSSASGSGSTGGGADFSDFASCTPLVPGAINLYWRLHEAEGVVEYGMEGDLKDGEWFGFGFADPALGRVAMVGADVTLVGHAADGTPFALDYFLESQRQCNYADERNAGVCPDSQQDAQLIFAETAGGVSRFRWTKPIDGGAADAWDVDVDVTADASIVWARGPQAPDDGTGEVKILKHLGSNRAQDPLTLRLASSFPLASCAPIEVGGGGGGGGTGGGGSGGSDGTLGGVTTIEVKLGNNPNYPNPPAWGISYHLNGIESPVLYVVRGTEYTFRVMASSDHPLYITSSIEGGRSEADEVVYAGSADSWGTVASPATVTWTPDASTPDLVYYQCWSHLRLGWEIVVSEPPVLPPGFPDASRFDHVRILVSEPELKLYWTAEAGVLDFQVEGAYRGWIGLGLSSSGGMTESDVWVMWVDHVNCAAGCAHDYSVGASYGVPTLDTANNLEVVGGAQIGGKTIVRARRAFDTGDVAGDMVIPASGEVTLIFAARAAGYPITPAALAKHDAGTNGAVDLQLLTGGSGEACPANCTSLDHGLCTPTGCACRPDWVGRDCATPATVVLDSADIAPGYYTFARELGGGYVLHWKIHPARNNSATSAAGLRELGGDVVEFAMVAPTTGWIGLGINPSDGGMTQADMYVGTVTSGGQVRVEDRWSSGYTMPVLDETLGGGSDVLGAAGKEENGVTIIKFVRALEATSAGDKTISRGANTFAWAYGSSDVFAKHEPGANGAAAVDLATGMVTIIDESGRKTAHGVLMFVAWGVMASSAALLARYGKAFAWWFPIHIAANVIAVLLTLVGFFLAVAFTKNDFDYARKSRVAFLHAICGLTVFIAMWWQAGLGILADRLFDKLRLRPPIFPDVVHWWTGRCTIGLALFTVLLGLAVFEASAAVIIVYLVYLLALVVIAFTLDAAFGRNSRSDHLPRPAVDAETYTAGNKVEPSDEPNSSGSLRGSKAVASPSIELQPIESDEILPAPPIAAAAAAPGSSY
ncbi:uncharacterized protein AMSG_12372 [Thecamonas trahens ATCC 50062]|uniref:DOMON domain-containing protein n=1 Tax=Thecamonas trahens ATCC 50062 TaxID=461836 RepID=A0A0L0DS00_THETB|nr:hypothetical protein AMSG_12372 [Thecamonas trahens ATCC 50062]KNC55022.1 hypothetical protein AMSG_12372 [Thecamonas trahens ATCC 50062]|eukprot:XP_013753379.1 hypothetical protein AMSG_12372 [Thecamonas trahens ATCC 50062]